MSIRQKGLRGQRLPGSERRCRVDYAFTQEGAEKIGTFSSLSVWDEYFVIYYIKNRFT